MRLLLLACIALPALAAEVSRPLLVEAEVDHESPWVQSQVTYTLRAWQGIDLREPQLAGPQSRLAEVRPLGPVAIREAERAGRRYRVLEQRFAVLPFASGDVELRGAHLAGRPPGTSQPLRIDAPAITLRVRPAAATGDASAWLPARDVVLTETWPATADPAAEGTAIRRRIRIAVQGVEAAQIPELHPEIPGARILALQPRLETVVTGNCIVGVREQEFQIFPQRQGPLTVPAIDLPWWSVGADSTAIAHLPGRVLDVSIAASSAAAAAPAGGAGSAPWPPIAAVLAATALAWLALRRRRPTWWVRLACHATTPARARDVALNWGARRWPTAPPRSLPEVAARLHDAELGAALLALDARLYGPPGGRR